jgi:hypothetical protein
MPIAAASMADARILARTRLRIAVSSAQFAFERRFPLSGLRHQSEAVPGF